VARDLIVRTLRAVDHGRDPSLLGGLGNGLFLLLDIVHVAGDLPLLFIDCGGGCQSVRFSHVTISPSIPLR
jgi:hypothetical protein